VWCCSAHAERVSDGAGWSIGNRVRAARFTTRARKAPVLLDINADGVLMRALVHIKACPERVEGSTDVSFHGAESPKPSVKI